MRKLFFAGRGRARILRISMARGSWPRVSRMSFATQATRSPSFPSSAGSAMAAHLPTLFRPLSFTSCEAELHRTSARSQSLSQCTGYRFLDWMRLLGFDLHQIPRLQVQLHPERTVLVTPVGFENPSSRSRLLPSGCHAVRESSSGFSLSARLGNAPCPQRLVVVLRRSGVLMPWSLPNCSPA